MMSTSEVRNAAGISVSRFVYLRTKFRDLLPLPVKVGSSFLWPDSILDLITKLNQGKKWVHAKHVKCISEAEHQELRRHLWTLIAEVKKTAHFVPNLQRFDLIHAAQEAEKALT